MTRLWEIAGGFIRVGNVYFGKNGRRFGSPEGLLPFDDSTKEFFVDDEIGERLKIHGDWIILKKARRAYHKDGAVAIFDTVPINEAALDEVDTRWPRIVFDSLGFRYDFYAMWNGKTFDTGIAPLSGWFRVRAQDPDSALGVAKKFHCFTGRWPQVSYDDGAVRDKVRLSGNKVMFHHPYTEIRFSLNALKPGEINCSTGEETKKFSENVEIKYFVGVPYEATFLSNGVKITIRRKYDETLDEFLNRVKKLANIRVVPGRAPYRAEIDHWFYTAWIMFEGEVLEVHIPYGYTLENVEFTRGRVIAPSQPLKKYFDRGKIVRVFMVGKPLLKTEKGYVIGDVFIGEARDPHDALRIFREKIRERNKKQRRKQNEEPVKSYPTIRIIWEVDPEYVDDEHYEYSEENVHKIREIIRRLEREYEKTVIVPEGKYPTGALMTEHFVTNEVKKIAPKIEEAIPLFVGSATHMHEDVGTYSVAAEPDVREYLLNLRVHVPSFRSRFNEEVRKAGIKKVQLEALEEFDLADHY